MYLDSAYIAKYLSDRERSLPNMPVEAHGDAIHLATALDAGETEIWSNDRHLLAAAAAVGLDAKCVSV
jgi:predicted nucleic acid-binding protein